MTMSLVETIDVGAAVASIQFASIPQDAADLRILLSGRATSSDYQVRLDLQFNNDTTTSYGYVYITSYNGNIQAVQGSSSSVISVQTMIPGSLSGTGNYSNCVVDLPNYTSNQAKRVGFQGAGSTNLSAPAAAGIMAGYWNKTDAITSVTLKHSGGNFAQYSTASLYKITNS